jgi:hypothetical protein
MKLMSLPYRLPSNELCALISFLTANQNSGTEVIELPQNTLIFTHILQWLTTTLENMSLVGTLMSPDASKANMPYSPQLPDI